MVNAQAQPDRQCPFITGQLPANTYVDPVSLGRFHRHLQHPQHGRMIWIIHVGDPLVHPIHRQHVLDEIIRADAEKIYFLCQ